MTVTSQSGGGGERELDVSHDTDLGNAAAWCDRVHSRSPHNTSISDELPMIYSMCVLLFALQQQKHTSGLRGLGLALGLAGLAAAITLSYLSSKDAVFHEVSFGVLVRHIQPSSMAMTSNVYCGHLIISSPTQVVATLLQCGLHAFSRPLLWRAFQVNFAASAVAFAFWVLDNTFCPEVC